MSEPVALTACIGRIRISLLAEWIGPDLLVRITGGAAHIGSVALATPAQEPEAISASGHREGELSCRAAALLRNRLNCAIAVVAGIHYDNITKSEIDAVHSLSFSLIGQFIRLQEGLADADYQESGRI